MSTSVTAHEHNQTAVSAARKRHRTGGRRKILIVIALMLSSGATSVLILSPGKESASSGSDLPPSTAKVTRETLTEGKTVDGELGYGTIRSVTSQAPGTVTHIPDSGIRITRGKTIYRVDDAPVTLMYGDLPAYRTMRPGDEGTDVEQLERNLAELGYSGFTADEEYSQHTADAVRKWQADRGLEETGTVDFGQVVFAPGAIRIDGVETGTGEKTAPGQKVLTYTGTAKAVTAQLDPSDQRLVEKGSRVAVTLPNGEEADGIVAKRSLVIEPPAGQGEEPQTKLEVIVELNDQQEAKEYSVAPVDVSFTADQRENVLTVPVAALVALREGGFGVEVVEGPHSRFIPVRTGLFADGKVEVSGKGVTEGTVVGMPK